MGVTGLLGLLKSIQKPCNLRIFAGQTLGVDGYGWLHRGAVACAIELTTGKHTTKFVDFAMHRVRMLIHFGVIPYIVFDGDRLPSKAGTEASRRDRRKESKTNGLRLLSMGKTAEAYQELQKAVDITPEMSRQFIEALKHAGVRYVVAPYEADSQLVYLEKKGIINGILSEDSDLLVFGAKCLLTKLDQYGECVMIKRDDFTACREVNLTGWTDSEFRTMAILSGCDYLAGIPKMGLKTAHRMVRKYKTIGRILRGAQLEGKFRIPPKYLEAFIQAEKTFLYQWVYCPNLQCLVNLTPLENKQELEDLTYIGQCVEPEIAIAVAKGDLNPMSKEQIRVDARWSQGLWTPKNRLKPKAIDQKPGKPLDSFFKPKRTPLAELDPNSFTPSPSQEQILRENGRPWSAIAAPASSVLPQISTPSEWQRDFARQRVGSAPTRTKRQRLCADPFEVLSTESIVTGERSRFFTSAAPEPSPSVGPSSRTRRVKRPDLNIWSDDSIDDAMAAFSEVAQVSPKLQKSKLAVFTDIIPSTDTQSSNLITEELPLDPADDHPTTPSSRLSAHLLRDTRALQAKFAFTPSPYQATTSQSKIPKRTPASRTLFTKSSRYPLTSANPPNPPNPSDPAINPSLSPPEALSPTTTTTATTQHPLPLPPTPKGSEDTLLIPASATGSPCPDTPSTPRFAPSALLVPATPPARVEPSGGDVAALGTVDSGAGHAGVVRDVEGAGFGTLRLERFVFG